MCRADRGRHVVTVGVQILEMFVAEIGGAGGGGKLDLLSPRASEDAGDGEDDGDRHSTSSDSSDDDGMGKMKKYVIQVRLCVCVRS